MTVIDFCVKLEELKSKQSDAATTALYQDILSWANSSLNEGYKIEEVVASVISLLTLIFIRYNVGEDPRFDVYEIIERKIRKYAEYKG